MWAISCELRVAGCVTETPLGDARPTIVTLAFTQPLLKLPMLAAFLAGALSGVASLWPTRAARAVPQPASSATLASAAIATSPVPRLQLESDAEAGRDTGSFGRNLFAFLDPPRPRRPVAAQVSPPIATPAPAPTPAQPVMIEPAVPAFPYRYIGTFGPRENVFAVFARDGDVINIRVGAVISDGFRLRRIDGDGVEVSWAEGTRTMRVPSR